MLTALSSLLFVLVPQQPPLPQLPAIAVGNGSNLLRFVDFHQDLVRPQVLAVVGTLDKWKEGRRQRLKEGAPLGLGVGSSFASSSAQYFKVSVKTAVQVRAAFAGSASGRLEFEADLQVCRLANGDEHFQTTTPAPAALAPGTMALLVLGPPPDAAATNKKVRLLHAIAFDPKIDTGASPQDRFVDTMHDFVAVNRRVADLEQGIAALQGAVGAAAQSAAKTALQQLLAQNVDLHQPEQQTLLKAQAGPFELRAQQLLAAAQPADGVAGAEPRQPGK